MVNQKGKYLLSLLFGLLLGLAGVLALKVYPTSVAGLAAIPYILIGLGAGLFGTGAGTLLRKTALSRNPALERQERIDTQDERNQSILAQAKAKAYDVFIYAFGAILLALAIVPDMNWAILLALVLVYLFVVLTMLAFHAKLNHEL